MGRCATSPLRAVKERTRVDSPWPRVRPGRRVHPCAIPPPPRPRGGRTEGLEDRRFAPRGGGMGHPRPAVAREGSVRRAPGKARPREDREGEGRQGGSREGEGGEGEAPRRTREE